MKSKKDIDGTIAWGSSAGNNRGMLAVEHDYRRKGSSSCTPGLSHINEGPRSSQAPQPGSPPRTRREGSSVTGAPPDLNRGGREVAITPAQNSNGAIGEGYS